MTHINLNDGSCAGLSFPSMKAMSLQYHPESSPGPHDADPGKEKNMRIFLLVRSLNSLESETPLNVNFPIVHQIIWPFSLCI